GPPVGPRPAPSPPRGPHHRRPGRSRRPAGRGRGGHRSQPAGRLAVGEPHAAGAGAMSAPVADRTAARRPDRAAAAALAGLPGLGPRRLSALVAEWGATGAWHLLVEGQLAAIGPRLAETVPHG